ncbi:MAG: alpha/beta hydrolase [Verrucomicrobiota bacterium]
MLLFAWFSVGGPVAAQQNNAKEAKAPEGGERHIYKTVGEVELPLYVFSPDGHKAEEPKPAMVFFFGGGWRSGSPNQFAEQCRHLAKRGIVAVTVDYRVSSRHNVKVEDCVEDAKSAMRWVRANAKKLGVDPERIGAGGGSAGGHLAACVAIMDGFNAESDDLEVSPKPNAMVLFNPAMAVAPDDRLSELYNRLVSGRGGNRTRGPAEKLSPLTYAKVKQPPCIMFFGTADGLLKGAEAFRKTSVASGNDCVIVTYDGKGHGFFNYRASGNEYFDKTVAEMDQFLVKLGWLEQE